MPGPPLSRCAAKALTVSSSGTSGAPGLPPEKSGPSMPRRATFMPVPLATMACSNEILVPSANEATMAGFWPHFSANARCVVGSR